MIRDGINTSGFTLIELMVVVAIIGIISSIAVPNFKKYQNKAKQTEAKIQLASVYNIEISAQADFDSYGTCLTDIGYDSPPAGYYLIGFTSAYNAGIASRANCASPALVFPSKLLKANSSASNPTVSDLLLSSASPATFTASASGNIKSSSSTFDKWAINHLKVIVNFSNI